MMTTSLKAILFAVAFSSLTNPLSAEWVFVNPEKHELHSVTANFLVLGTGETEDTAIIRIKYKIKGKWLVARETDITVNDKGHWTADCKAPVPTGGRWAVADGPDPTPYRIELYEGKTLKASRDFRVVDTAKRR